ESELAAATVSEDSVPDRSKRLALALNGGDDYELLFTAPPNKPKKIPSSYRKLKLTAIGEITRDQSIKLRGSDGKSSLIKAGGWDPFALHLDEIYRGKRPQEKKQ